MPLFYVLQQLGRKMGVDPNGEQRPTLLLIVNEAARELYDQSDMPGSVFEQTFKVNGDQTISTPSYVAGIRGVRESQSMLVWHVHQMRPRYDEFNWKDMWRNIRLKNEQCLQATVTNQSVGVISVPFIENPPIQVTVSGPTANATCLSETITMDSLSQQVGNTFQKQTVNQYTDYIAVTKNTVNLCDVTLEDVDGKLLTTIPNCDLKALYQIWDVSMCPWLPLSTSPFDNYIEVIFKKRLYLLNNNSDEFVNGQYDDILVNKCMQLWQEEQGKVSLAAAYDTKATRTLARKTEEQNRDTEDVVALVANPHDTMIGRVGIGFRRRFGWGRRF